MINRAQFFLSSGATVSIIAATILSLASTSEGVILFRTADPAANTIEPTGGLAGSGWQYQGRFGNFLGTPIAPNFFITARHIGGAPNFYYRGGTYTVIGSFHDPDSDLAIHQVAETFPAFAPLFTRSDEVGARCVVIGRGTRRGPPRVVEGELRGWEWGASDMVQRWGENQVARITDGGRVLYSLFDQAGLPHEAHLSGGDSGGAVFIKDGSAWKLAGINLDVDSFSSGPDGGGPYNAAMFDQRGSYTPDGTLVMGPAPVPSGFYATRISSRIAWINSITERPPPPPPPVGSYIPNDFNVDSQPDLVWQNNTTGQRAIWLMNGTNWVGERFLPTVATQWQIAGNGDFNGDGHADLVWQNGVTGERAIWLMNGTTWVGERFLQTIPASWQIAGTGDFNGDRQVDLVWQHNGTGQRAIWLMNGANWIGERFLPTVPTQWKIAGTDDFSGDGQVDIVWQNSTTGQRSIWLMNGTTRVNERFLPTIPTQWQIAGTGDFNNDRQVDLIWQNNSTGQRSIWLMDGTNRVGERFLPAVPTRWQIRNL